MNYVESMHGWHTSLAPQEVTQEALREDMINYVEPMHGWHTSLAPQEVTLNMINYSLPSQIININNQLSPTAFTGIILCHDVCIHRQRL